MYTHSMISGFGVKRFKPNFYALVLMDIMMPKMGGIELYEQLKKIHPDFKVCFLLQVRLQS